MLRDNARWNDDFGELQIHRRLSFSDEVVSQYGQCFPSLVDYLPPSNFRKRAISHHGIANGVWSSVSLTRYYESRPWISNSSKEIFDSFQQTGLEL